MDANGVVSGRLVWEMGHVSGKANFADIREGDGIAWEIQISGGSTRQEELDSRTDVFSSFVVFCAVPVISGHSQNGVWGFELINKTEKHSINRDSLRRE